MQNRQGYIFARHDISIYFSSFCYPLQILQNDYTPVDLTKQIAPTLASQESIINALYTTECGEANTVTIQLSHYSTACHGSNPLRSLGKSASADNLTLSGTQMANTSGYSTGCSSDNGIAVPHAMSMFTIPCSQDIGRETNTTVDLEFADAIDQPGKAHSTLAVVDSTTGQASTSYGPVSISTVNPTGFHKHIQSKDVPKLDGGGVTALSTALTNTGSKVVSDSALDSTEPLTAITRVPETECNSNKKTPFQAASGNAETSNCHNIGVDHDAANGRTLPQKQIESVTVNTCTLHKQSTERELTCTCSSLSSSVSDHMVAKTELIGLTPPTNTDLDSTEGTVQVMGIHHCDRMAISTSSDSCSGSLIDYAGYLHIETPL